MELSAIPTYSRGDRVGYKDHQNRFQTGEIQYIEAKWFGYDQRGNKPFITYQISHPTYRNRRHYATAEDIVELIRAPETAAP